MVHGTYGTGAYAFEYRDAGGLSWNSTTSNLINFIIVLYGPSSATPGRIEFLYGSHSGSLTTSR